MPERDENVIDYVFRARDADRVTRAAREITDAFKNIRPATDEASEGLAQVERASEGTSADFGTAEDGMQDLTTAALALRGALGGLSPGFLRLAGGIAGVAAATVILGNELRTAIQVAAAQEDANVRLANSMQSAGQFSRQAVADFQAFANAMQETTAFADNQVITMGALIQQISKLSGETLERATRAALDLAAALGRTDREAGIFLGKLAQGETGFLSEIGIVIDQTLPRAEKFIAGLEALEAAFGGTAQATARSYTGTLQQMQNAFDELRESLVEEQLPALSRWQQGVTEAVLRVTQFIRDLRQETGDTIPEIVNRIEELTAALPGSVDPTFGDFFRTTFEFLTTLDTSKLEQASETTSRLRTELEGLRKSAIEGIEIEVKRGNIRDVASLLERVDAAFGQAGQELDESLRTLQTVLRATAGRALEAKIEFSADQANAELRNALRRLEGEVSLEARIEGTPSFQRAVDGLRNLSGVGGDIQRDLEQARQELVLLEQQLNETRESGEAFAGTIFADPELANSIERQRARIADLEREAARAAETIRRTQEEVAERLRAEGGEQELLLTVATRIDAAESTQELQKILEDLDALVEEFKRRAESDAGLVPLFDAMVRVNREGKALADTRRAALEFAEGLEAAAPAVERTASALLQLKTIADATTFDKIRTDELVRNVGNAAAVAEEFRETLRSLLERDEPEELARAWVILDQTIRSSADGVQALDDDIRETLESLRDQVRAAIDELQPLERARIIQIQGKVALDQGSVTQAVTQLELLRALAEEFPDEIRIRVVLEQFEAQFNDFIERSQKAGDRGRQELEKAFAQLRLDAANEAAQSGLDVLFSQFDETAVRIEDRAKAMVDFIIRELTRIAITNLFANIASGGNPAAVAAIQQGLANTPLTKAEGGAPPTRDSTTEGPPVRQFVGEVARPLHEIVRQVQLQNAVLSAQLPLFSQDTARQVTSFLPLQDRPQEIFVEIRALDTTDFERYMRDGPGARAIASLAQQGRF